MRVHVGLKETKYYGEKDSDMDSNIHRGFNNF